METQLKWVISLLIDQLGMIWYAMITFNEFNCCNELLLLTKPSIYCGMTVWSTGVGFTDRLFHTITCAPSRRAWHTANYMCGVWNRQWGDPLGDRPGHQASRYLPWRKWHQKWNMTWDFKISTSGILGDFWYINHGYLLDNSWKNQLVTNFFHLYYRILSNALGLIVQVQSSSTLLPLIPVKAYIEDVAIKSLSLTYKET